MHFECSHGALIDGELVYRKSEYSIDFRVASPAQLAARIGSASSTSFSFATLQIEVGIERGDLLYPWGLFPATRWQGGRLSVPMFTAGRVQCTDDGNRLRPGVSIEFPASASWPIIWDRSSGWICVGDATPQNETAAIEYAKNASVVLVDRAIVALWIKPEIVP